MTEAEWLTSRSPIEMLRSRRPGNKRKLRLFACACCRNMRSLINDARSLKAIEAAENWADGCLSLSKLHRHQLEAKRAVNEYSPTSRQRSFWEADWGDAQREALEAAFSVACENSASIRTVAYHMRRAYQALNKSHSAEAKAEEIQVNLLRDIFGNPFRPITLNPCWLTPTVLALANGIYQDRAFDRMPILADALQDASCDHEDVLNHCREAGEHVRGCWMVDLLTGRS